MFRLTEKQRKACLIIAVTSAVYFGFRYLLPLFLPFLAAYVIAICLRPTAVFLERRLQFHIRGRRFGVPIGVLGGIQLILAAAILTFLFYYGGCRLLEEADRLVNAVPEWIRTADLWLADFCRSVERFCRLEPGILLKLVKKLIPDAAYSLKTAAMPKLVVNSFGLAAAVVKLVVLAVILLIASILCLQEMDELRSRRYRSLFHREFFLLGRRLCLTGAAWLKTQGILILLISGLCTLVLLLLKSPYAILGGIGIGLLDALPVFGSGTVLIPWGIFLLLQRRWARALLILGLHLSCYFLREYTEARLMGKKVGLSALETLVAMYVGLKLFGLLGFLLGPVGLLIIRDLVEEYEHNGQMGKTAEEVNK
ncbi:MAG: AI-2E family transporter [Clostridium sp.]|nr:AI-2E family transporter [Clostridium sp.]